MTAKQVCCSSLAGLAVLMIVGPRLDYVGQQSAFGLCILLVLIILVSVIKWGIIE